MNATVRESENPRRPRANTGMSREAWREYKRERGIVTYWDTQRDGICQRPQKLPIRTEDEIRAEVAQMLSEQLNAQRERWGFA